MKKILPAVLAALLGCVLILTVALVRSGDAPQEPATANGPESPPFASGTGTGEAEPSPEAGTPPARRTGVPPAPPPAAAQATAEQEARLLELLREALRRSDTPEKERPKIRRLIEVIEGRRQAAADTAPPGSDERYP